MTEKLHESEIYPYLNPNYWNGHTLGYTEYADNYLDEISLIDSWYNHADSKFAKNTLRAKVETKEPFALQTYANGTTFDPRDFQPGSVVLYRSEMLYGKSILPFVDIDELSNQPRPFQDTSTYPSVGRAANQPRFSYHALKIHYASYLWWGVVPKHEAKNRITVLNANNIIPHQPEVKIMPLITAINVLGPLVVGDTIHHVSREDDLEEIHRVNTLKLISYGSPSPQRRRIFDFMFHAEPKTT